MRYLWSSVAQHTPPDGRCETVAVVEYVSCRPVADIVGRTVE